MLIAIACLLMFLVMAALMYTRRMSALLALPIMAVLIGLVGGIPPQDILVNVMSEGALRLHNAYTTTMFGAMLAELVNRQGIARALIRWVAEFSGDNPFIIGILLTLVTALLFSTLGGLGAVIMVGTIVLPVMLSLGIANITAGGLFLFGISLGGMFNLSNWQLYVDVLNIERSQIAYFVVRFAAAVAALILTFLAIELRSLKNIKYILAGLLVLAAGFWLMESLPRERGAGAAAPNPLSLLVTAVVGVVLIVHAASRHARSVTTLTGAAMLTPFVPLALVLVCHWEIIPAFLAGIAYGGLSTWQRNSINILTRSIIDGVGTVIPAVVLMIGIGMLLAAVTHPSVSNAMVPLLARLVPTHAVPYVVVFTALAPLSLYRGPLSLWGMGSGLVALVQKTTVLGAQAIMGMLMSVGQIQAVCDPTNTHNIWVATYLGTDTQALLRRTIPYVWGAVFAGLCMAAIFGYVPW